MEKDFKRAIIVGKFCPLHKGHEYLINTALNQVSELIIFSYTSHDYKNCSAANRKVWLETLFPAAKIFVFDKTSIRNWGIEALPDDDDSDLVQRQFVARVYEKVVGKPLDVIYTSESYGDGFTKFMSEFLIEKKIQNFPIKHLNLDQGRNKVNISGTKLREDILNHRQYLSAVVYRSFIKKILFLGAESTGKSTLVEYCAEKYKSVFVDEFGRTLYEQKKGNLEFEDLLTIAETHKQRESIQIGHARDFLFVDTSPLTTLCYSLFLFEKASEKLKEMANDLEYDHIFYCIPDFPMFQDGTRVDENFRMRQHQWYLQNLALRGVQVKELHGSLDERKRTIHEVLLGQDSSVLD